MEGPHLKLTEMKKTLVTGATGHLGANLVRRLLGQGEDLRVLLQEGHDHRAVEGLAVERVVGDLRDYPAILAAARGCDRIYHTAAKVSTTVGGEREIYDTNVVGTRHVLKAAQEAGVSRVVVTGSFSAVGHTEDRSSHEGDAFYPFEEHMPYERSKAWVEHECMKAVVAGLDVVIAISCAILGPNDFMPSRMGRVVRDFANRKMNAYLPGGFEFVAARDIAAGHVLAMEKGRTGQRYIFSTRFVTVDELVSILARVTGQPPPRLRLPPEVMMPLAHVSSFVLTRFFPEVSQRFTPGAVRILGMGRRASIHKAQTELGYQPTSIEDALQEAYEWFVERGEITHPSARRAPARAAVNGVVQMGVTT
jgi:nucleoside-diphosphate-sugar epimerase